MAASPPIKIYRNGLFVAACHYPEDAAAICGMSEGTEARWGHEKSKTIFREPEHGGGCPDWAACNSWDMAAEIMIENIHRLRKRQKPELSEA